MKKIFYLAIMLTTAVACNNNQNHDLEVTQHDDEGEKIQLIAYSNELELFAEADPFVIGQHSEILAHFSYLDNFSPVDSGSITLRLISGSDTLRQTINEPVQDGIYLFDIEPVAAGKSEMIFHVNSPAGEHIIEAGSIMVFSDMQEAENEAEEMHSETPGAIIFTKEQSWKVDFATREPLLSRFGDVIRTTAQILPAQNDMISVVARTSGVTVLSGEMLYEGTAVRAGQSLFAITESDFAGKNLYVQFVEARNNYEESSANYERSKILAKDNIITESELLKAKRDFEISKASYENLSNNFDKGKQLVKSPLSGYIHRLYVHNGEYVEPGQKLLDIVQTKKLVLMADVQEKYADMLPYIETARIQTRGDQKTYTLEELNGALLSYGRTTNTSNFMIPVRFEVENKIGLVPGGFADIFIIINSGKEELSVPDEAILEEEGNYFVMVQITPESFIQRKVEIAQSDGENTVITKGLDAHDRIVTRGAILVKLSRSSGALDPHAGHVH